MERYFSELATAFVRGRLGNPTASIDDGLAAGLRPPMAKAARGFPDSFSPNYRMTPGQIVEIQSPLSRESEGAYNPLNRSVGLLSWVTKRPGRTYKVVRTARTIPVANHGREFAGQNIPESLVVALKILCHSLWRQWDLDSLAG